MTEFEIVHIRQKLLSLRSELQQLEDSSREEAQPVDPDEAGGGGLSRRAAMQAQIASGEGSRQRKRLIQKIDGALRRIESGEYGKCFICEEELELSSLIADPTLTRCANCIEE